MIAVKCVLEGEGQFGVIRMRLQGRRRRMLASHGALPNGEATLGGSRYVSLLYGQDTNEDLPGRQNERF